MGRSKTLSNEFRSRVIAKWKEGQKVASIAKQLSLPWGTVKSIIKVFEELGIVEAQKTGVRPRKINETAERKILREVKKNPFTNTK